jgi:hypothetical protein
MQTAVDKGISTLSYYTEGTLLVEFRAMRANAKRDIIIGW